MSVGKDRPADNYLERAKTLGLHKVEPQLALRVAQQLLGQGQVDDAEALLALVLKRGSTNPSHLAIKQALAKVAVHRAKLSATAAMPASTSHRRARPASRVRINQFMVSVTAPHPRQEPPHLTEPG